jgi:tetratricopeptide (TPR) repeat protein
MKRRGFLVGTALAVAVALVATGCTEVRTRLALNKGNELYTAQKYEEAIEEYEKILNYDPDHWMANYLIAMSYVALYRPGSTHEKDVRYSESGIAQLEKLLDLTPPNKEEGEKIEAYYLSMLTSSDQNAKAIEYLERKFAENPQDANLAAKIGDLALKSGNVEKALDYLQKRANLQPDNKEAWYTIGVACWARSYHGGIMVSNAERAGLIETGMEALEKALEIDSEYFDALSYTNLLYREKMKALVAEGKNAEAQEAYQKAEEYLKRALEVRNKQNPQPGAPESEPKAAA